MLKGITAPGSCFGIYRAVNFSSTRFKLGGNDSFNCGSFACAESHAFQTSGVGGLASHTVGSVCDYTKSLSMEAGGRLVAGPSRSCQSALSVKAILNRYWQRRFVWSGIGTEQTKVHVFAGFAHRFHLFHLGEEWGFIGVAVILLIFLLIFYKGITIARRSPDKFSMYLAAGITMNITLYAFINAGVVSALLPTTGLPMPFSVMAVPISCFCLFRWAFC